jgi:hypothetical protein
MANPLVVQGTLNRLRGSVLFAQFPAFNVTAPFVGPEGISLTLEGRASTNIPTMTGIVTSPEPYMLVTVQMHLLKTQSLADAYKAKMETSVLMGDCVVRPDSKTLSPYLLYNTSIINVADLTFNGTNAGYGVSLEGYWVINADLWESA